MIIYIGNGKKSIKTGDMLGDMTDEISGKGITNYASTGPKSYSLKYGDDKQKSAIKGFTLNHENNSILNHYSLSKIVKSKLEKSQLLTKTKSHEKTEKS